MRENTVIPYGSQLGVADALLQMRLWFYKEYGLETVYVNGTQRGTTVYQVKNLSTNDLLALWVGIYISPTDSMASLYTVVNGKRMDALVHFDEWDADTTSHRINARVLVMKSDFEEVLQKHYKIYPKIKTPPATVSVLNVHKRTEPDAYVVLFDLSNGQQQSLIMDEENAKKASSNDIFTLVDDVYTYYPANKFN